MKRSLLVFATTLIVVAPMMYGQGTGLPKTSPTQTSSVDALESSRGKRLFAQNDTQPVIPLGSPNVYGEIDSKRILKTGDVMDVQISKDLDLNVKVQVDRNGDVDIPYVGKVAVAGKTMGAAIDTIQKKISEYFLSTKVEFPDAALPAIPVNPADKKPTPAPPTKAPTSDKNDKPAPAKTDQPGISKVGEALSNLPWPNSSKKPSPAPSPAPAVSTPEPVKPAVPVQSEPLPLPEKPKMVDMTPPSAPVSTAPAVDFSPKKKSEKLDVDFLRELVQLGNDEPEKETPQIPPAPVEPAPFKPPVPVKNTVEQLPPPPVPVPMPSAEPVPSLPPAPAPLPPPLSPKIAEVPAPLPKAIEKPTPPAAPKIDHPQSSDDKDAANELFKVLESIVGKKEAPQTPATTTTQTAPDTTPAATAPTARLSISKMGRLPVPTATVAEDIAPLPAPVAPEPQGIPDSLVRPTPPPVKKILSTEEVILTQEDRVARSPLAEEIRRAEPITQVITSPEDLNLRTPTERLIQVGDLLDIKMPDEPDLNLKARVTREGRITLPYAGDVMIVGKTLQEATKLMKSRLAGYYVNPVITLSLSEAAKGQFVILGQVERPGVYDIPGSSDAISLTEALAKASGTLRYGDIGKVTVKRNVAGDEKMVTFDAKAMTQGAQNFIVMPGDTIIVRLAKNEFSILGEIRAPGLYAIPPMQDSVDLMEAIAMAGGAARFGDFGEIVIKRTLGGNEQIFKVDAKALGRNESTQKVPIYPGDTIIVRLLRNEFVILGQVQRPGTYSIPPLQDNVDMLEALALAGGATRLANLNSITVRRTVDGKEIVLTVNMNELVHGERVERFPVLPGDRIVVSERMF